MENSFDESKNWWIGLSSWVEVSIGNALNAVLKCSANLLAFSSTLLAQLSTRFLPNGLFFCDCDKIDFPGNFYDFCFQQVLISWRARLLFHLFIMFKISYFQLTFKFYSCNREQIFRATPLNCYVPSFFFFKISFVRP